VEDAILGWIVARGEAEGERMKGWVEVEFVKWAWFGSGGIV